ncbi:MAG: AMP-binding protein [Bacteroidales bacterium]|nr:AMP-binding protein [Bacteroidales bacterium]
MFTNLKPVPEDLHLNSEQATLVDVLHERSVLHPEKKAYTFLVNGDDEVLSLTYGELETCARRVAMRLTKLGLNGKNVLLFYSSGIDFVISFFGCLISGTIPVTVYPPRKNRSLERIHLIVSNCGAESILTTEAITRSLERNFSKNPLLKTLKWYATEKWAASDQPVQVIPEPGFEELAFLQYTSGSTGDPKGVMVSHRNIMYNLRSLQILLQITENDVSVNWIPQFHDLGLVFGILETVFSGYHAVLISPINFISDPFCFLKAISHYHATLSGQPDFAFNHCIDKTTELQRKNLDLSSLRVLFSGAETVRKSTFDRFLTAFSKTGLKVGALFPGYGMAESTLILTCNDVTKPPVYLAVKTSSLRQNEVVSAIDGNMEDAQWVTSTGKTSIDTSLLIVDPETKEIQPPDKVGEIWASGSTIAMGYWGNPGVTKEVFKASPAGRDEPFWLRTGDLGFLHDGMLFITGRLKDLIIINGRNFYPQDIEKVAEESHSSIRKTFIAAFPIEMNGKERIAIVAELRRTILPPDISKITEAIMAAVSLEFEVKPARITLVQTGSVPKTSSNKVMRRVTREYLLANKFDVVSDYVSEDVDGDPSVEEGLESSNLEQFMIHWVSRRLNNGLPADPEKSLVAYGIDSLRALEFTDETKKAFDFEWPPYLFFEEIPIRQMAEEGIKIMEAE